MRSLATLLLPLALLANSPNLARGNADDAMTDVTGKDGSLPPDARAFKNWQALIDEMASRELWYGAMAAASRAMVLFADVGAKEAALRSAMSLSDIGMPGSIKALFLSADLEPGAESEFGANYFFYKALVNQDKGFPKWSEYYFKKVLADKSELYQFFLAVRAYAAKDAAKAKEILTGLLAKKNDERSPYFSKRLARMLARIYFEEKQYERSLEIYQSFLLKTISVTPLDWLEAAWNLYHLKRYSQALGYMYNLEARSSGSALYPEKFILRGLIYNALCDRRLSDGLLRGFETEFKPTIIGIKTGEALNRYGALLRVSTSKNTAYREAQMALTELKRESAYARGLRQSSLAAYLYSTEIPVQALRVQQLEREALEKAAEAMVLTHEGLRFISFEIAKAKFDPDKVFKVTEPPTAPLVGKTDEKLFYVTWLQPGDYWRDERFNYLAEVRDHCSE